VSSRFRRAFYKLAPSWLTSGEGEAALYSLGLMMDTMAERYHDGLHVRYPDHAPDDALSRIGRDRKILRGINEPAASYAARLKLSLDYHKVRGNPFALLEQVRAYCQADVRVRTVDRRGNWFTIDTDGARSVLINQANWDWDGAPVAEWARFWLIIYPTAAGLPWAVADDWGDAALWGAGVWGTAAKTIGTTATANQVAGVRSIVRDGKPAGTTCEWIIVAFDDASFDPADPAVDPSGDWGGWSINNAGTQEPVRLDTARYWRGHE
jgi:hypothetical protein